MKIFIVQTKDKSLSKLMSVNKRHIGIIKSFLPKIKVITESKKDSLEKHIEDTDILIMPTAASNLLSPGKIKHLKWIHTTSAGVDNLPKYIVESPIRVTSSSGVHPIPISEHVMAFMLMFARQIVSSYRTQIKRKKWIRDYRELPVFELYGKTIGILGFGRIGKQIAKLAKGFDMKVLAMVRDIKRQEENVDKLFDIKSIDSFLSQCDFAVNSLPLTKETYHFFDNKMFSRMKKTAYFINIGRGKIVKEKDLIEVLKKGKIAGAGLDVFEEEPLSSTSELWDLKNVIITPHYSGWTPFYMDRVIEIFSANLKAYLNGEKMPNLIDKKKGY
ncbi:MAG: D-2-hydroxyacid dehydrogenase [bacterium]|nr:D-2-hydroxyacid dehydrogenase [bacterium]